MQCPLCRDAPLEPKFVGSTEVDICSRCRGIWLDRGELDRLLDGPTGTSQPERAKRPDRPERSGGADRRDRADDDRRQPKRKSKAKRLADLFEDVLDL